MQIAVNLAPMVSQVVISVDVTTTLGAYLLKQCVDGKQSRCT